MSERDSVPSPENETAIDADRRRFLRQAAALCASVAIGGAVSGADGSPPSGGVAPAAIPRRTLGKTGLEVSILGVGGYTLAQAPSQEEATKIVGEAFDAGINYFDTAWEYGDGTGEQWLGSALQGHRDKVILTSQVCTHGRDKSVGMRQLEESLKRLGTDHLDLWLIHEVNYWNDPELIFAKDGVIESAGRGQEAGEGAIRRLLRLQGSSPASEDARPRLPV